MNFGWTRPFNNLGGGGGVKSPASPSDIIQRFRNGVESGTTNTVNDVVGTLDDALYVNSNYLLSNGSSTLVEHDANDIDYGFYVEGWVKASNSGLAEYAWTVSNNINSTDYIALQLDATDRPILVIRSSVYSPVTVVLGASLAVGWHKIKVTLTNSTTVDSEIDGVAQPSDTIAAYTIPTMTKFSLGALVRHSTVPVGYWQDGLSAHELFNGSEITHTIPISEGAGSTSYNTVNGSTAGVITDPVWDLDSLGEIPPTNITNGYYQRVIALQTDGVDDLITGPSIALGSGDFEVSIQIKIPFTNTSAYGNIIGSADLPSATNFGVGIAAHTGTTNQVRIWASNGAGGYQNIYISGVLSDGWHSVSMKRESGVFTAYSDGVSFGSGANAVNYTSRPFYVMGGFAGKFVGATVFDALVDNGTDGFLYKLDEGEGSVATDSLYSNDGSITGGTWVSDTSANPRIPALNSRSDIAPLVNVVCFGDSNTARLPDSGYVSQVGSSHLCYTSINEGVPGDTSADLVARYSTSVTANYDPAADNYLFIMIGVNDNFEPLTVEQVIANLTIIGSNAVSDGFTPIFCKYYMWPGVTSYLTDLNNALVTFTNDNGYALVDPVDALNDGGSELASQYQWDPGVDYHINQAGHDVLHSFVQAQMETYYPNGYSTLQYAANLLELTNVGGYVHNGAESLIRQSDSELLGQSQLLQQVDIDGTPYPDIPLDPDYVPQPGTNVTIINTPGSFWSADGLTFDDKSYSDLRAHPNGSHTLWLKCREIGGVPHYEDLPQYILGREFTVGETSKNEGYYGDNCGTGFSALRDVGGDLVTDVDGNVIFTS